MGRQRADVNKLFITFAISFLIIHQLILVIMSPPSKTSADAKTCVETEKDNFFCTDDAQEARKRAHKSWEYYLQSFGVAQTIEGSGEENMKMRVVDADMIRYFKRWILKYDHVERYADLRV